MAKTERAGSTWVGMQNVGAVALITKPGKSENLSQALGAIKQAETGGWQESAVERVHHPKLNHPPQ